MTTVELRALYTEAVKIMRKEKAMREFVFSHDPPKQQAKMAEIDRLCDIFIEIKDVAKQACEPGYEQPNLIDVPAPAKYQ